jgi:hypothetical protein
MQINGIGKLHADGEALAEAEFTLFTTPGFPTGRGELRCAGSALHEAYGAARAALSFINRGEAVEIMIVGSPDGDIADFVAIGQPPRHWGE